MINTWVGFMIGQNIFFLNLNLLFFFFNGFVQSFSFYKILNITPYSPYLNSKKYLLATA